MRLSSKRHNQTTQTNPCRQGKLIGETKSKHSISKDKKKKKKKKKKKQPILSSSVRRLPSYITKPGLEVIKLEYSLKLKIKHSDWLLADTCPQAANHCPLFWVLEWTKLLLPRGQDTPKRKSTTINLWWAGPGRKCHSNRSQTIPLHLDKDTLERTQQDARTHTHTHTRTRTRTRTHTNAITTPKPALPSQAK